MQAARGGERAARQGQEGERDHHNSSECLPGPGESGLLLPPGQANTSGNFQTTPSVCQPGLPAYECCWQYKTITDCVMKSN